MGISQVQIRPITAQEMRDAAISAEVNVPIEQTWVWAEFEETFPDRDLIGFFAISADDQPVAIFGLTEYDYHGFTFVWCKHGPVWLVEQNRDLEQSAVQAMVRWIKKNRPRTAFLRLHLLFPLPEANPPMQITTYDRTVVVELADNEDDLMAGYKPRTRTQVRSSRRKTPVECSDDTEQAIEDITDYYELMAETAERQGFTPWSETVYSNLLRTLKREHARLYAARVDGRLVAFTIFTLSGSEVVYYYAAANEEGRENRAPAQLLHYALSELGTEGFATADLMGIGSDRAPSLEVLTPFKTGFAKEVTEVAPAYDVPVSKKRYKALEMLREGKAKLDTLKTKVLRREKDD